MADLEILDENGRDILHLICMSNNQEYLEILLAQDPPIF
jgi:ankyrin repeat protein